MGIAALTALPGCATTNDPVRTGALHVERLASPHAEVAVPSVRQVPNGLAVRGAVKKSFAGRGPIPGHVHLVVIDPAGNTLTDTPVELTRASVKARSATYHAELPIEAPYGSTLQVMHHTAHTEAAPLARHL
jgi:hypothetical protein